MSSYNNSKAGKTHKGQIMTVPGSPTGEPTTSQKFAYSPTCCSLEYLGEAKFGTPDNAWKWYIQKFEYDSDCCSITAILNACNQVTTKATQVSVDTTGDTKITISGGVFDMVNPGDSLALSTPSNTWVGKITQKLSDTEVLVDTSAVPVDETGTSITDEDLIITLEEYKDFSRRRWDKREFYVYA